MYQSTMVSQGERPMNPVTSSIDGTSITRRPNGDIEVKGPEFIQPRIPKRGQFDENLVHRVSIKNPKGLAAKLVEYYNVDIESRKDWESRERRALHMMGITEVDIEDENDTAPGMARMTHPMLMEAAVRFQANAIVELFPAEGPAKAQILGKSTREKEAKGDRIIKFINYYLTQIDRGYFADTDQMLLYLPMSGSCFRKGGQNWVTGMPELRYIKATNFIAPYAGTDLANMPRYAHQFTMTGEDIERSIVNGLFADTRLTKSNMSDAMHPLASDLSDDRVNNMHDEDSLYSILEYHIDMYLEGDSEVTLAEADPTRPYIIVVEKDQEKVLMIRRNWREKDKQHKKRIWFAHHKYLPGLGFYGFGLPHVIGSLGNAASGAVNALLDGAQMASFNGGFKTKEGKSLAGEMRLEPGVWKDVDAAYEDISKAFYTPPYHPPAPALFQTLSLLVDAGQRFAGTADVAVGDANNNAPVGTTVALIEQSQKPQSAIHKRLHVSMSDELRVLTELIEDFMPNDYVYSVGGDTQHLLKSDFDGTVDVVSVTDPEISSQTMRIQIAQAVEQSMQNHPDLFTPKKREEAVTRMFKALKVPDFDAVAPKADTPMYLDAVTENGLILQGKGVRVYQEQDDQAHIKIHQYGAASAAAAQMDPNTQQMILAGYGVHLRDHMAQLMKKQLMQSMGIPMPPLDEDGNPVPLDPHTEAMLTAAVLSKLPPPPQPPQPPATAPSPADKAQQQLQANQQLHEQKMSHQQQMQEQKLKFQNQDHGIDVENQTQSLLAEQARKDAEAKAEAKRKNAESAAGIIREGAKAKAVVRAKVRDHQAGHQETSIRTHLDLRAQAQAARDKLMAARATHRDTMAQRRQQHEQELKLQSDKAKADMDAQAAKQDSAQSHGDEMNRQKRVAGKVALQQKRQATKLAKSKPKSKK